VYRSKIGVRPVTCRFIRHGAITITAVSLVESMVAPVTFRAWSDEQRGDSRLLTLIHDGRRVDRANHPHLVTARDEERQTNEACLLGVCSYAAV
jgi:hypothetical protein